MGRKHQIGCLTLSNFFLSNEIYEKVHLRGRFIYNTPLGKRQTSMLWPIFGSYAIL